MRNFLQPKSELPRSAEPPGPKGYPLVGNLPHLARDPLGFLSRCLRDYGNVVRLDLPERTYLLGYPDHVEHVLLKTHKCFVKAKARRRELETLGNGLIVSEGELWRCQRRLMQPAFHQKRVSAYAGTMVDCARRMTEGWKDGQRRDLHRDMVN